MWRLREDGLRMHHRPEERHTFRAELLGEVTKLVRGLRPQAILSWQCSAACLLQASNVTKS